MPPSYPRDMIGYGAHPPHANWPDKARIAVQFVLNYEEGGENNILHGDEASEAFLSEIVGAQPWPGQRHMNMESIYEYGSRRGFWRLYDLFTTRAIPVTVFGVAMAMQRNRDCVQAMLEAKWEIATHGLKWIDYRHVPKEIERAHIEQAVAIQHDLTGTRPLGIYQGRTSENTLTLSMQEGGFLYSADSYADDLPYWISGPHGPQLIVPYTLDANDMRFATPQGFNTGDQFFTYLKDSFDALYAEGATAPKMLSIGLHCRLVGRPGRAQALARFLDYVQSIPNVWCATRLDIAKHWIEHHPPKGGYRPAGLSRALFCAVFGGVYEHSPWIAEAVCSETNGPSVSTPAELSERMREVVDQCGRDQKLRLINAHPDLSGKLAKAKRLTSESTAEQASAGLDQLTAQEQENFTQLNETYKQKFGFVFILAVRGKTKQEILTNFQNRLAHSVEVEFAEALSQIHQIALMRIEAIFKKCNY
jgi:OHCU decarboxylase